ncbi:hypothetical protein BC831DRAFT_484699 [Entophlyctis helioformis]|nr:hypothetical protein BC831DRAFT_484699 [Entophlyctis helioformis]
MAANASRDVLHVDVLVIGSGAGGKIARPAASLGLRVAYIERGPLGGTCLNRGCIPSKMLIHPADVMADIDDAAKFGISTAGKAAIDRAGLVRRVCEDVDGESAGICAAVSKHAGVTLLRGDAVFTDPWTVAVTGSDGSVRCVRASRIFIATGCRAHVPDIPGLAGTPYLTYEEALRSTTMYQSMIVIGGGYISVELGYYFGQTGTRVEFLVRSKLVASEDDDVRAEFERVFRGRFPGLHTGVVPVRVHHDGKAFHVECEKTMPGGHVSTRTFTAEALLVATGVRPNTDTLGLGAAGVQVDDRGYVVVDDRLCTTQPHVWAFGDVIGRHLFRHTANYEGSWVFEHVIRRPFVRDAAAAAQSDDGIAGASAEPNDRINYPPVPHAVFSNPQIGGVGMTQREAIAKFGEQGIIVGRCSYDEVAMGNAMLSDHGFCKLIFERPRPLTGAEHRASSPRQPTADAMAAGDRKTRIEAVSRTCKLVGTHIVGREASTLIHMPIAYMRMGASLADMMDTIYVHPALPELVRDAARSALDALDATLDE